MGADILVNILQGAVQNLWSGPNNLCYEEAFALIHALRNAET